MIQRIIKKVEGSVNKTKRKKYLQDIFLPQGIFPSYFSITLGMAACNHSCLFCPQSVEKPKEKKWLELEVLEKVLNGMPEKGIELQVSSYSETIFAPNLIPALKLMKKIRPNLPVVLATNGASINKDIINEFINIGLDVLQFSFDAADRKSYTTLMQVDNYEKAVEGLNTICRIRDERKSNMKIITHIMAFANQKQGYRSFRNQWKDKVDSISIRNVGNWGDDSLTLKNQLAQKGFVPLYQPPSVRYPCASIFSHFKVSYNGFYYPCIAYIPGKADNSEWCLGDAREISFFQAWERLGEMRNLHLQGKWNEIPLCRTCDVWGLWKNMFLEDNKNGFYL